MKKIQFRINKIFKNYQVGDVVPLECDDNDVPIDPYWFRRFKDSEVDCCISAINDAKKNTRIDKKESELLQVGLVENLIDKQTKITNRGN